MNYRAGVNERVTVSLPVTVIDTLDRARVQDVGLFLAGIGSRELT